MTPLRVINNLLIFIEISTKRELFKFLLRIDLFRNVVLQKTCHEQSGSDHVNYLSFRHIVFQDINRDKKMAFFRPISLFLGQKE